MSTKRPSSERATERVMRTPSTLALAIVAGLLAIAVGWLAAERGFGPFAQPKPPLPKIVTGAPPSLPKIVTGAPLTTTASSAEAISPNEITVIDGDTIRARGRTVRLVGFDAPDADGAQDYRHDRAGRQKCAGPWLRLEGRPTWRKAIETMCGRFTDLYTVGTALAALHLARKCSCRRQRPCCRRCRCCNGLSHRVRQTTIRL